jgi:hypothetical protein
MPRAELQGTCQLPDYADSIQLPAWRVIACSELRVEFGIILRLL